MRLGPAGIFVLLSCLTIGATAASVLSEAQARAKAVDVLNGDPYGRTRGDTSGNIKQATFIANGDTRICGVKKNPVWEFHVVVVTPDKTQFQNGVIDGFLYLDAFSGKLVCASLPLLE